MAKAAAQVPSVFVKGDTKKVERGGVSWLASDGNTVVRFKSWSDANTLYRLQGHEIFQGVPFTQEDLDRHYPELKYRTRLTKAKIGSAKVGFLDIQSPLAVQHQGHTYMVAPMFVDTWTTLFPASMINPTHTAEQQKYLDTHEQNLYIAQKTEIIRYHVGIEKAIRAAKCLEKQGHQVTLQKRTQTGSRPVYTVLKVLKTQKAATPVRTAPTPAAPKRKKQPVARKPAPNLPPILTAPPELAADVLGAGLTPTPAAPKRKPAAVPKARKPKKTPAAKPRKTTKKTAKPKTKKTTATPKLTASQQEYLAIQGFVMVKRGGKYVRITG